MLAYTLSRLGRALVTVVLIVTLAFVILRLTGDPATIILGPDAPPQAYEAFRRNWGLDQPLWVQYLAYFGAIAIIFSVGLEKTLWEFDIIIDK